MEHEGDGGKHPREHEGMCEVLHGENQNDGGHYQGEGLHERVEVEDVQPLNHPVQLRGIRAAVFRPRCACVEGKGSGRVTEKRAQGENGVPHLDSGSQRCPSGDTEVPDIT